MEQLTHLSLFTGIGGLDIAAEWAGFQTVGQCEWADYPTKVLEKHWPNVPRWRDIKTLTKESFYERTGLQTVTCISGGFPCQPHSTAGKRLASLDERDLWGEAARIVCEIKPTWFVGENVWGLLSSENGRFYGRILRDLAEMGYYAGWCCFPASWVGAVYSRERVAIVAIRPDRIDDDTFKKSSGFKPTSNSGRMHGKILHTKGQAHTRTGRGTKRPQDWQPILPESGVDRALDGVPHRMDRLKCLGNAVVPQQFYPVFAGIAEIERRLQENERK